LYTLRAEIVSVGTELLLGQIVDTNAAYIARKLPEIGVSVYRRTTVGDNHDRLLAAQNVALEESDLVIAIGGLGPTMDDITRDVLSEAMEDTLHEDPQVRHRLEAFFRSRGLRVLESNLRQAMVPTNGRSIDNPNGTAPGLLFEQSKIENRKLKIAIALPGPPNEFIPMVENHVIPYLREKTGGKGMIRSRIVRVCSMGESLVEDKVKDLTVTDNPTVAPYAKLGEVHLRVTAKADSPVAADQLIAERIELIKERLGDHVYGFNDESLESVVVKMLIERGMKVATAESCTGGMLASRITDVPGSSVVFPGGVINYSNESKTDLVYVPAETIAKHGAVSPEVAEALAIGARKRFGSDFGIGITGVAGPNGGTDDKPVGLVYIGLADANGVIVEKNRFIGQRKDIRFRSTQVALVMLRSRMLT
jgi:nicotinamide-nucleotide amidase